MALVMRCLGLAARRGGPVGQWLQHYNNETGESVWTHDKEQALRFEDPMEAFKLWTSVHAQEPIRHHDGKPNRPLTAFTVEFESV